MRVGRRRLAGAAVVVGVVPALFGCSPSRSAGSAAVPTIPPLTVPTTTTDPGAPNPSATTATVAVTTGSGPTGPGPTPAPAVATPVPAVATTAAAAGGPSGAGGPTLPPISPAQWNAVDAALQEDLLGRGDFAFALAVSVDGVPVHESAFGVRNSPDIPLPPPPTVADSAATVGAPTTTITTTTVPGPPPEAVDTGDRFRIASISKMITGTVVLQLVADGTLALDEPVGALVAAHLGVDVGGRPVEMVTVRQLLSHTAGFGAFQRTFFERGVETCGDAARRGLRNGLQFSPGTTFEYSNMNFCVLHQLIETVTGQPYEQVAYERLLAPLGLDGMRLAGTFDPRPDEVVHPSFPGRNYMEVLGGAGAWVATAADVVAIVDALDPAKPGWHPLPPDLAELMRQAVTGIEYRDPAERWYGLATIVFANRSWGHTGTVENTHSIVLHRPDGMTWALLVSGNTPEETDDLIGIFQAAVDRAGIPAPAPTTSTTTTTTTTTTTVAPTPPPGPTTPAGAVPPPGPVTVPD